MQSYDGHDQDAKHLLEKTAIYPIAGRYLPETHLGIHDLYLGQIGCGKTLEFLQKARRALQPVNWHGVMTMRHRALFFDAKGNDLLPSFRAWVPPDQLAIVNPSHPMGVRWAVGVDCPTFEAGEQLGHGLIPTTEKSHPFFNPAARQILHSAIQTLQLHGDAWFLSDVVIACTDERLLRHVLSHHPQGSQILSSYLPDSVDTSTNILQTMRVELSPWRTASLLERKATEAISIKCWMETGGVLGLLGSALDPDIVTPYNALFFKYVVRHIRGRERNLPIDNSYLLVDEMPKEILDDYVEGLLLGRSKGLRSAATIQDPASLITRLGSRENANEILGQIGNLWTGRLTGPDAAEWLSRFYGKYEHWIEKPGWSYDGRNLTSTGQSDIREEYNIYPYDFQSFPPASLDGGYTAVAMTPSTRGWRAHVPGDFIKLNLGPRDDSPFSTPPRILSHDDVAYTWGPDELKRLGLRPLGTSPPRTGSGHSFRLPEDNE